MSRSVEEIIDESLDALLRGESVEWCLARFPEYAEEIEPLLRIAQATIDTPQAGPNPQLKSQTWRRIHPLSQDSETDGQFEDALSRCIDLLVEGHSLEKCLSLYPRYAEQLAPLLRVAAGLHRAFSIQARPVFKKAARRRVLASMAQGRTRKWMPWVFWPKWAYRGVLAASLTLVVVLMAAGTFRFSSESMPEDMLYPVKELSEKVQVKLATSKQSEAELHVELANRRAHEMAVMAEEGNSERVQELMLDLGGHLEMVPKLIQQKQKDEAIKIVFQEHGRGSGQGLEFDDVKVILDTLHRDVRVNVARFKDALQNAPVSSRGSIEESILTARAYYHVTIQALEFGRYPEGLQSSMGRGLAYLPFDN